MPRAILPTNYWITGQMKDRSRLRFLSKAQYLALFLVFLALLALLWQLRPVREEVNFVEDIQPVLQEQCLGCHGGVKREEQDQAAFIVHTRKHSD